MYLKKFLKAVGTACVISTSFSAHAYEILFAHVDNYGSYVNDGNGIANMLSSAGHNVTIRNLNQAVYTDYSSYDQIFVYDLYAGNDNSSTQSQNYAGIANWYNSLSNKNLILDGRIISSYSSWTNANGMSAEDAWIQNYATQLGLRGGGLVLGTDHYAFQSGINEINAGINIGSFSGFFGSYPTSQAIVDSASPLFVSGLDACRADATTRCINDNSTTGFVASGLQANGQMLTPVAYHGSNINAWDYAAISSTMGSITFGTCGKPGQPPCVINVPEPGVLALFVLGIVGLGICRRKIK